ncbi:MAG TPA: GGDEF domain-containing protein [Usitatibacter sp.]|jgi:diguanylate cyclase (GGDEF)-like protein|nr:GGDEF domain-containing protein [Usitatibacter sp.]
MPESQHDPSASPAMTSIVRMAVVMVTIALFIGSTLNAMTGLRDLAIVFSLATPLGICAWGFARAGYNEAALALLSCVLIVVVTLVLVLSPLGIHDPAVTAYGGIVLMGALLLSRRSFYALATLALVAASVAFVLELTGVTRPRIAGEGWSGFVEFLVVLVVFATLGRYSAEVLFGSVGAALRADVNDALTSLSNRRGFMESAAGSLKAPGITALVLADLDNFRRVNVVIGHRAADAVLDEAATRVRSVAGSHLAARLGDDEFAVLATGLADERVAEAFARELHRVLQFEYSGVSVRCSVGFARYPRDAHGIESLLLAAEGSLTRAKDREQEPDGFAGPADRI